MKYISSRRQFLQYAMLSLSGLAASRLLQAAPKSLDTLKRSMTLDTTQNVLIPNGTSLRIVAESNQAVLNDKAFVWHNAPDGGACFATEDAGWIYVSNSEVNNQKGGVGAIRFNANGDMVDAYSILENTTRNCAGGKTPWNTWLSCEEFANGQVYECDPFGKQKAQVRPAMGSFDHEAAAFDPKSGFVYLTEDKKDGCLYRFKPENKNDLSKGVLEVAVADKQILYWKTIHDPLAETEKTRYQVQEAARFKGAEGIIYHDRKIFFTTKIDNIVWRYHLDTFLIDQVYNAADYTTPLLTGVDNIEVSPSGELLIAEDGGDMQIIALDHNYEPYVLVAIQGQDKSEITGPAFSPDGKRLYFSSQRGKTGHASGKNGITYELTFA